MCHKYRRMVRKWQKMFGTWWRGETERSERKERGRDKKVDREEVERKRNGERSDKFVNKLLGLFRGRQREIE